MENKPNLLLIPESRKRPITESLLYKQIIRFFEEEKITDKFEIAFITIVNGVIEAKNSESGTLSLEFGVKLPPKNFRSGRLWISKEVIEGMAQNIIDYLQATSYKLQVPPIAYVRGSYLEAVKLASKKSGIEIKEIFTEDELGELKKKGWLWMKVGLRMPEAFGIFERRIKELSQEEKIYQLKLF